MTELAATLVVLGVAIAIGVVLTCFFFWLRDRFHLIIYKIENIDMESPSRTRTTTAIGEDGGESEDADGDIGFKPKRVEGE